MRWRLLQGSTAILLLVLIICVLSSGSLVCFGPWSPLTLCEYECVADITIYLVNVRSLGSSQNAREIEAAKLPSQADVVGRCLGSTGDVVTMPVGPGLATWLTSQPYMGAAPQKGHIYMYVCASVANDLCLYNKSLVFRNSSSSQIAPGASSS